MGKGAWLGVAIVETTSVCIAKFSAISSFLAGVRAASLLRSGVAVPLEACALSCDALAT
jgi:hypothetical protein